MLELGHFRQIQSLDRLAAARHHRWRKTEASKLQRSHHRIEHQPATIRLVGEFLLGPNVHLDEKDGGVDDDQGGHGEERQRDE